MNGFAFDRYSLKRRRGRRASSRTSAELANERGLTGGKSVADFSFSFATKRWPGPTGFTQDDLVGRETVAKTSGPLAG